MRHMTCGEVLESVCYKWTLSVHDLIFILHVSDIWISEKRVQYLILLDRSVKKKKKRLEINTLVLK